MNSPLRLHLVNHNLRYIDWPHGYGDPSAYWRSVGQRHASGPMVLTEDLAAAVLGSPAMFARKLDLEMPEGVDFMQRWDKWMSYKLQTGTDHDAVQVGSAESRPQPSPRPAPLHPEPLRVCVPRVASTAGHRIRPTRGRRHAACNSASAHGRGPQRSRGGGDCRSLRCASCPLRARRRDAPPVYCSPAAAAAALARLSCRGAGQRWKARRRKWRSTQPPWPPRRSRRRTMCPAAGAYARLYSPTGAPGRWCDDAGRDFGVQYASSSFTALRAPCRPTQSTHIGIPTRVSSV